MFTQERKTLAMSIFSEIEALFNKIPDLFVAGEKPIEMVEAAEGRLETVLPVSFRKYLQKYGNLSFGPIEYYGLTVNSDFDNSSVPNFVWFTLRSSDELPDGWVVFRNDNGDMYFCLDTSSMDAEGECPVGIWDRVEGEFRTLEMTFAEYLKEDLAEYAEEFG